MKNNIVIATVPWTDTESPLIAPAVLKSALHSHGLISTAIDLNAEVKNRMLNNAKKNEILEFFLTEQVSAQGLEAVHETIDWMANRIMEHKPAWVCLSLLTYLSQIPTRWLCLHLKQKNPDLKIVIGGPGCFNTLKSVDGYALTLKKQKLIDYFISGDGEKALPELLLGNETYPGINSAYWEELQNLDQLPVPDYDDYNWNLYTVKRVGIWGSRGCVRSCTFCDIHEHWSKFQWRTAESIFAEMKQQYEKYGINIFSFSDSLINGNQKEYRKLIRLLAEFNQNKSDQDRIKWTSFFIFRPKEQMTEEDWRITAESGAALLSVGVESFVDHIRDHIKKKFNNQDLEHSLQMCKKYKIKLSLLTIVGYVTETQQDHDEQIAWIRNHKHYAQDPVVMVHVGSGLAILPGTELHKTYKSLGIVLNNDKVYQDWTRPDIGNTPELRLQWHQETVQELDRYGFNPTYLKDNHVLIEQYLAKK